MNKIDYTISELVNILVTIKETLKSSKDSILKILESKKGDMPLEGVSNMLVIEFNITISFTFSWILDSSLNVHVCTSIQGLIESRRLREREMILRVRNGARIAVVTVGTYPL